MLEYQSFSFGNYGLFNMNEESIKPTDKPTPTEQIFAFIQKLMTPVIDLYHPDHLKKMGMARSGGLIALTVFGLMFLIGVWWSSSPSLFNVQALAQERAEDYEEKLVPGYATTNTLIEMTNILVNKSGGYLSNDIMPPSIFMDDMASWEWGVLQQIRDLSKALRNDISSSRTQAEDPDLAKAEPLFNTDNQSWFWPESEDKYLEGAVLVEKYLHRLAAPQNKTARFLAGSNNLRDWLEDVTKRLASLSQRLSASVGQMRINTNVVINTETDESNTAPLEIEEKTPWTQVDNVFYETRGTCYALIHFLQAIEIDFAKVLKQKNATMTLQQVIRELKATQKTIWSLMVLNGSEFGLFANHSLVLSSYISRANTGIIELYTLLERG
ncbi:conserved hypothetical protein [Beggiatoa sp. PS]|nr:conserved hypothetical protein [Beggiatoa sp. PS]